MGWFLSGIVIGFIISVVVDSDICVSKGSYSFSYSN